MKLSVEISEDCIDPITGGKRDFLSLLVCLARANVVLVMSFRMVDYFSMYIGREPTPWCKDGMYFCSLILHSVSRGQG